MYFMLAFLGECWSLLCQMSPALLGGFLAAGVISAFISPEFIRTHLGGGGLASVAKSALLGVPMPLCSCGVLPVAASLKKSGASTGAVVAFLISVPQTGADNILVVWSLLGGVFAIYSPIAAFLSGLFGGVVCEHFIRNDTARSEGQPPRQSCCDEANAARTERSVSAILTYSFVTLVDDIAGALIAGIAVAAGISMLVPNGWLALHVGPGVGSMLLLMLVGIPLYVCSSGSVPIAAAFMAKGASPGAALVFLMTGPTSNATGIAAISKMLGFRCAVIYVGSIVVFAFMSGFALNGIYALLPSSQTAGGHVHDVAPAAGVLDIGAAILLCVLLCSAILKKSVMQFNGKTPDGLAKGLIHLEISGMTCSHCANSVKEALSKVQGVASVAVSLADASAVVTPVTPEYPPTPESLKEAVESAGFKCDIVQSPV